MADSSSFDIDGKLVRQLQAGRKDAFELLVRRHQHRVYNLAYRILHNREVAQEVSQEAFISVYRHIGRFRGGSKFTSWLYRIVVNQCHTTLRRLKSRPGHTTTLRLDGPSDLDSGSLSPQLSGRDGESDPSRAVESRQDLALVQQALDELEEDYRVVLLLRDVEDLNYTEIAEVLGIPEGTVKSRIHRARNHLRELLSKYVSR